MSDAFNDAGKLRQELADVWAMLRSTEADNDRLRGVLNEALVQLTAPVAIRRHPDFAKNLIPRIDAALAGTADQQSGAQE